MQDQHRSNPARILLPSERPIFHPGDGRGGWRAVSCAGNVRGEQRAAPTVRAEGAGLRPSRRPLADRPPRPGLVGRARFSRSHRRSVDLSLSPPWPRRRARPAGCSAPDAWWPLHAPCFPSPSQNDILLHPLT